MATTTTKSTTKEKTNTSSTEKENKELKLNMKKMQEQMEEMQKLIASLASNSNKVYTNQEDNNSEKFDLEEDIPVASMCPWQLNLCTEPNGKGDCYTFSYLGEVQDIPFGDLKDIVRNNKRFSQEGVFYILNERAVEKLRLKNYYKKIISVEDMEIIFTKKPEAIVEMYKIAPKEQKEVIVSMIIEKKFNKQKIDANILMEIGNLCGKDLINIENPMEIPEEGIK